MTEGQFTDEYISALVRQAERNEDLARRNTALARRLMFLGAAVASTSVAALYCGYLVHGVGYMVAALIGFGVGLWLPRRAE